MHIKPEFRGRIIELWSHSHETYIELIEGDHRSIFKSSNPEFFQIIQRGDLVLIKTADPSNLEAKTISYLEKISGPYQEWSADSDSLRWRRTLTGPSRMSLLWKRQNILTIIRDDLTRQGFLEVESPLLIKGTCPDSVIESVRTDDGYLVTSTEYQIKRMMVGGFEKVFTLTKNFRSGDRGQYHSTEFTMLEWARAYEDLDKIEEDAIRFIQSAFKMICPGSSSLVYNQETVTLLNKPWEKLTVREALKRYLGLENLMDFSLEALLASSANAGIQLPPHFQNDKHLIISFLLDLIQPYLGKTVPTFLREWPAYLTSSAQLNPHDPTTAVRSELFIAGVEIADGFPFLRDPNTQMNYFKRELEIRQTEGKNPVSLDIRYLESLAEGIPPGAGMALGVDRLIMVLTGAQKISDVQAFSWDEI